MKRLIHHSLRSPTSLFLAGIFAIAVVGHFMVVPQSAAPLATFTVNSTVDLPDLNPGDGICNADVALCTLRAAIMESNYSGGANVITVPAGTYTLSLGPADDESNAAGATMESGDLDIVDLSAFALPTLTSVTINGAGAGVTIIDGGGIDRVLDINNFAAFGASVNVTLNSLTIRNGNAPISSGFNQSGGGIQFDGFNNGTFVPAGTLTINNCNILNNTAAGQGGGILAIFGSLVMSGSDVSGNTATRGAGGGISYDGSSAAGLRTLDVNNSKISGNHANNGSFGNGGGIWEGGNANKSIVRTAITGNTAGAHGGGVFNGSGSLTLNYNAIAGNTSGAVPASNGLRNNTGAVDANNNWWGCNGGPAVSPCDRASGPLGAGIAAWLQLQHTATPNTIGTGQSTTLLADFFTNSLNTGIPASDLVALDGRAITFSNAVNGSISGAEATINAGKANATFTAGAMGGTGSADATVDHETQTATISITEAPSITCPENIVTDNDPGVCTASVSFAATATGAPAPTITYAIGNTPITSPHVFPGGTTTVTATASNSAGEDSCTFTVTVHDNEAPSISCPANLTTNSDPGSCGAVVTYTAPTGTDNCEGATTVQTAGLASGSTFPVGTTTNTFTVTDAAGNEASCSFTVTVEDNEDPVVTVPANIVTSTDPGTCAAVVTFNPTATDNCPGVTVISSPASGSTFPKGTTTVTVTATDASGNQDVDTFTVTVNDTEAPVISCPANIIVDAPEGECAAQVNFTITAHDNCPGTVTINSSPASGSFFPVGTTTVNASASDASGNVAHCSFTVTVRDKTAPVITLNGQTPVLWPPDHDYRTINVTDLVASASDECDAGVDINDVVIAQVSSDELEDGSGDGNTLDDIVIAGDCKSVQLRAERQNSGNGRVYTITFKVTDAGGNTATITGQVIVPAPNQNSGAVNGPGPGYTVMSLCP